VIQIRPAGGFFRARYAGHASFVFGATAAEARERLFNTPSKTVRNSRRKGAVREINRMDGFQKGKA